MKISKAAGPTPVYEDSYEVQAKVNAYVSGLPDTMDADNTNLSAWVKFRINMEHRSWGVKSIRVDILSVSPVSLNVETIGDQGQTVGTKQITAQIDASKLPVDIQREKGSVTVGEIDLYLDLNGQVDYAHSTIEVWHF